MERELVFRVSWDPQPREADIIIIGQILSCDRLGSHKPRFQKRLTPLPRSPDLDPCDFYLWGHLKDMVYRERYTFVTEFISSIMRHCCMKGILETGGVMGQCVQMWTRNYGALDQTARVCFGVLCANRKKEEVKRDFGPANKKERGACCEHTPGV
ncbi:hypothetical protein TNCV_167681 [Trichonephila clavipes]|nr:hypothetical protein TNCV_167681 [Trichonephila clavipes]